MTGDVTMSDSFDLEALRAAFTMESCTPPSSPIHPGEILREEFLAPLGLSAGATAKALGLPRSRIERIVKKEIGISTDTALRLARLFRTTPDFWTNLQALYERETLLAEIGPELDRIEPVAKAA